MYVFDFRSLELLRTSQAETLKWVASHFNDPVRSLSLLTKLTSSHIQFRSHALAHYWGSTLVQAAPDLSSRMVEYSTFCNQAFRELFEHTAQMPDHLVHVSCTGYTSPSPAHVFLGEVDNINTGVSQIYHMGCYAALVATNHADAFIGAGKAQTLSIVHTELCTLHADFSQQTVEQMVINSLFSDGVIKYTCSSKPPQNKKSLKVLSFLEERVPHSQEFMTWNLSPFGFVMHLGQQVPTLIQQSVKAFVEKLVMQAGFPVSMINEAVFCIHPGGPRIIDAVAQTLQLTTEQIEDSLWVLQNYGNMSSATLPTIWQRLLASDKNFRPVVSLAFGPGLTLYGSVALLEEH